MRLLIFLKKSRNSYHKEVEKEHAENLVQRRTIIDKLKKPVHQY